MFTIRRAIITDAAALRDTHDAAARGTLLRDYPADLIEYFIAANPFPERYRYMLEHDWCYLAEEGGHPIGMAVAMPGRIRMLYVLPAHQGRGVGAALLATAEADAGAGVSEITLHATLTARGFYSHHGYVTIEEGAFAFPDKRQFAYVKMRKQGSG